MSMIGEALPTTVLDLQNPPTVRWHYNPPLDDDILFKDVPIVVFSPADQSIHDYHLYPRFIGDCSYPNNIVAFMGKPKYPEQIRDGTSNTIAYAERYARCGDSLDSNSRYNISGSGPTNIQRRVTFGDRLYSNVVAVTAGAVTRPSRPGATFQVAPHPKDCDPTLPQTPHHAGMLTAMLDGSVRTVGPGVAEEMFWAAATRDAGDGPPAGW